MRLTASPSRRSLLEQQREQLRRRRVSAPTLADTCPTVEQVRIQLEFRDTPDVPPNNQAHDLFPAAAAFFEFPCPYGDCDGVFSLHEAVSSLLSAGSTQSRGQVRCAGTRAGTERTRCSVKAVFRVTARYQPPAN